MGELFLRVYNQVKDFYVALTPGKRFLLWAVSVVLIASMFLIGRFATDTAYTTLYTGLDIEDSSLIISKLRDKKIPFRAEKGGETISVPPDFVYETRLMLATEGLPGNTDVVGLEIFDKTSFGMSSYIQKINYLRAKEGELTRTINRLTGVERSRVHITLPEKKTFVEEQEPAKASVVLKIKHGHSLTREQVAGVQHLVASAVENLTTDNVSVIDQTGQMLSSSDVNSDVGISNKQLEYRRKIEKIYEQQIISMLERVTGPGKVVAKVNADIDFSKENVVTEDFDPDKIAVRSKVVMENMASGSRPSPTGIPGARANLPETQGGEGVPTVKQDTSKTTETINNEISKTITRVAKEQGEISRLSIAVLVDGKYETVTGEDGEVTGQEFSPLPKETIDKYAAMISNAVGAVDGRDKVTVECMQFQDVSLEEADRALVLMERWKIIRIMIQYAVLGLLIVLFFFFFVRPFIKWVTESISETPEELLPTTLEELESMHGEGMSLEGLEGTLPMLEEAVDPDKAEGELLRERVMALIEGDPLKATQALTEWIYTTANENKEKAAANATA
ncbi:MAG: flagellar M-ring protein FliF [Oligoflexia bacterium]|nr:flagellar M-ring protein FliF [Oligoflexia bacterium]